MRKIKRPNKPSCFNIDTLENYKALKDRNGKIRVNAVAPGLIKTEFSKKIWENFNQQELNDYMGI